MEDIEKEIEYEEVDLERLEEEFAALEKSLGRVIEKTSNLDGQIEVELSEDRLEAYITLIPPQIGGAPLELDRALEAISKKDVVGVDESLIATSLKNRVFRKKILIAKGIPPTKGEDAYFEYRFGVDEDGTNLDERALPGQLLMVKHPATYGTSGKTVTGETIPGELGKELAVNPGNGVILSEDSLRAYATDYGSVIWEDDQVSVEKILKVSGDLKKNLDFKGRVIISGSVKDGLTIKASSEITVCGNMGEATLVSGGRIKIEQPILGKGNVKLVSPKEVLIKSATNITIESDGDVLAEGNLDECKVTSKGRVICRGQITGGKTTAKDGIEGKVLGKESKVSTILAVDKEGRISASEAIHPGVKITIGKTSLEIKKKTTGLSFEIKEAKIKELPYQKTERSPLPTIDKEKEGITPFGLSKFVIVSAPSLEEGRSIGAHLLEIDKEDADIHELRRDDGVITMGVFQAGVVIPWEKFFEVEEDEDKDEDEYEYEYYEYEEEEEIATIEINEDKTKVEITLSSPKSGREITYEEILKALHTHGVKAGIKEEVIKEALKNRNFNNPMIVAEEIPPFLGETDRIEYAVNIDSQIRRLKEDESGRINFYELNTIENVRAGQVLARKVSSDVGSRPGYRITGEEIPPPPMEEAKFLVGKNTEVSEDGRELRATIDGHVVYIDGRINIEPVYEVKGNVDFGTGNINFLGSLFIEGGVKDGFKLRAEGDIQIKGGVGRAKLTAKGSIRIDEGIYADHLGSVWAGKDIICKFVEGGDLYAQGSVIVGEEVLHSFIDAEGNVIVNGKRGSIVGGRIRAKEEVIARTIGCEQETTTSIEVGIEPKIRKEMLALKKIFGKTLREFEMVKANIMGLRKKGGQDKELLKKLLQTQHHLARKLVMFKERKEAFEVKLARSQGGMVKVLDTIYPGVAITIRNVEFVVTEKMKSVTFCYEGGIVKYRPNS